MQLASPSRSPDREIASPPPAGTRTTRDRSSGATRASPLTAGQRPSGNSGSLAATPIIASRLPASAVSSSRTSLHLSVPAWSPNAARRRKSFTSRARSSASGGKSASSVSRIGASRRQRPSGRLARRAVSSLAAAPRSSSSRLAIVEDRATVGVGHAVRQKRHQPDQAMRGRSADRARRAKGRARRAGSSCGRCRRRDATDRPAGRSSRRPSL